MKIFKRYYLILLFIILPISSSSQVQAEFVTFSITHDNLPSTNVMIDLSASINSITIDSLMKDNLPKLPDGIIYSDNLEFKAKLKKDVLPVVIEEMKKMGWEELLLSKEDSIKYFFKIINGQHVRISMTAVERGGPEKENISTFIYFKILSPNTHR